MATSKDVKLPAKEDETLLAHLEEQLATLAIPATRSMASMSDLPRYFTMCSITQSISKFAFQWILGRVQSVLDGVHTMEQLLDLTNSVHKLLTPADLHYLVIHSTWMELGIFANLPKDMSFFRVIQSKLEATDTRILFDYGCGRGMIGSLLYSYLRNAAKAIDSKEGKSESKSPDVEKKKEKGTSIGWKLVSMDILGDGDEVEKFPERFVSSLELTMASPTRLHFLSTHCSSSILLLLWPRAQMALEAIRAFQGQWILYSGEGRHGCCADHCTFDILDEQWKLEEEFEQHHGRGIHSSFYLYRRLGSKLSILARKEGPIRIIDVSYGGPEHREWRSYIEIPSTHIISRHDTKTAEDQEERAQTRFIQYVCNGVSIKKWWDDRSKEVRLLSCTMVSTMATDDYAPNIKLKYPPEYESLFAPDQTKWLEIKWQSELPLPTARVTEWSSYLSKWLFASSKHSFSKNGRAWSPMMQQRLKIWMHKEKLEVARRGW